ncbi:sugar porter (SP) family MFS transporter [Allocatelliglobosispora scoriae]|uniref:Sugar porter (SP) family MFS transporter n=1 Tax=Allocatelliglobosispora scoriae TaxID=643052 RepID=A0A841BTB0_9ACTN|nr:sugar porter family MFS transporter [Allocatelliglobosispora scoriae]MBB5870658.1 sugar porter (SP) family MFS transporter [Allocatelliglobosispora scoriae]
MDAVATRPANTNGAAIMIAATAAMGGFLFGFDTAVINGTVDAIQGAFNMNAFVLGFVVASALLGCAVGAWFAGPLADKHGRIRVMVIAAIVFAVGSVGSAVAIGPIDLTIWRVVGGLAVGAASVIAPAYIAEISPAAIRGRLGSLQQLAIVVGIFIALLTDYALAEAAGGASEPLWFGVDAWRWMLASEVIPAAAYLIMALRIPESPRYLVRKGRIEEARQVLTRVIGDDADARLAEIQRSMIGANDKVQLSDLKGPRFGLLPIVWVGILLSVFQQFVGINIIFYYSSTLWQAVGFTESDSLLITVITSVTNIVTTLIAIALVDKVGRKPLLLFGAAGMVLTLGAMAWCFANATVVGDTVTMSPVTGKVALVAANLYVVAFGMSWGPVVWVLLGEMFNNTIRVTALAVAAAAQWIANWLITVTFPPLSDIGLGLAYLIYTIFAALAFLFVLKAVRETKGRELEEM